MIRDAKTSDIEFCLSFQGQTNENYWSFSDFTRMLENELTVFQVAEENNKIVGYCVGFIVPTKQDEGALHETRVDVNYRQQGIGSQLVHHFCNMMFEQGVKTIYASITKEHQSFYVDNCGFSVSSDQWIEIQKTTN